MNRWIISIEISPEMRVDKNCLLSKLNSLHSKNNTMLNFANLFNQFRSSSSSSVSDLLEQPGTKITRLLDEDSFVN